MAVKTQCWTDTIFFDTERMFPVLHAVMLTNSTNACFQRETVKSTEQDPDMTLCTSSFLQYTD